MDTTFISILDLSRDARLLYVSNSVTDILGYQPREVIGRSCWDYFHPEEVPFAQAIHDRGVQLDKAAVLSYCRIKNKVGLWVGCECVFTIVHDVLVGCTTVYRVDERSQRRAKDAPIIRQLFSSSPKDPRYHMLSYISCKFSQGPRPHIHEPRAALFVNRFTRTLTIMYATNGLAHLLGVDAQDLVGSSFYYCIQENCLPEAIRCLESAKANDSIAYLRFWFRDPRRSNARSEDDPMSDTYSSDQDSDDGGVRLNLDPDTDASDNAALSASSSDRFAGSGGTGRAVAGGNTTGSSSGTDLENGARDNVFDRSGSMRQSSTTSMTGESRARAPQSVPQGSDRAIELEAVISCTSDGLVVIIREARPIVLDSLRQPTKIAQPNYADGFFASPWGQVPILPDSVARSDSMSLEAPHYLNPPSTGDMAVPQGPGAEAIWQSIRECAVFAWGLTGINGSLAQFSRGSPFSGAQPHSGLPVWVRDADQMDAHMQTRLEDHMEE